MSGLPFSWVTAPLGAFTIDCGQRVPEESEEFKYIDIGSVNRDTKRIETPQQLLGKNAPSRARKHVKAGDVLVSMTRPNLNSVALVPDELDGQIASTGFDVLRASSGIEHRWVSYLVRTDAFVEAMSELVQGALYPAVRPRDIRGFEAPLAPLNEQKRIADKLDAVLARVDACCDRLDLIPAILKRFRQSILAAATSGKLTEDWRDENAYLLDDWTINLLGNLVKTSANGLSKRRGDIGNETVVLRLADFKNSERVQGNERTIKLDDKELKRYSLTTGDLLVVRVNGSRDLAGKFIIYESRGGEAEAYCDHFIRLRLDRQIIAPQFALFVANSGAGRHYVESVLLTTAGQNTINQTALFGLNIGLPPLAEQIEIVRRVEALFACADRLEARHKAARAQVQKLTLTTLAKAFRGELVPQDPNDEPASVLLQRIRAQHDNKPRARL